MPERISRWIKHAACIGLMALVAVVCATGAGLPSSSATRLAIELRAAERPVAQAHVAQALTGQTADPTIDEAHR